MKLLLDTCTFLWLAADPDQISSSARSALDDSANELWLSDVTIWEIVLKRQAGKLPMPEGPRSWIPKQVAFFGLVPVAVDAESVYLSGELADVHRDPFDRLLCAQAMIHGLALVTPDLPIRKLGARTIW